MIGYGEERIDGFSFLFFCMNTIIFHSTSVLAWYMAFSSRFKPFLKRRKEYTRCVPTSFSGGTCSGDYGCWCSPCSCVSVPLFRKSAECLQLSEPRSSFCCFTISSISLELFLLNTPEKQRRGQGCKSPSASV